MSVRFLNNYSNSNTDIASKTLTDDYPSPWVRNPSWISCEANPGDNKVTGLYAVFPNQDNFFALSATSNYTIDFGDGTITNFSSSALAYYNYSYSSAALVGTEAPVTFTDSTNLVTRVNHGYINNMTVKFFNIQSTTNIVNEQFYFVINATNDTFQISNTQNGTAIDLINDGTGQLLPYRIARVIITPQSGFNLFTVNLFLKNNQVGLANGYCTGWLDLAVAMPFMTGFTVGSTSSTIRHNYLERIRINQAGSGAIVLANSFRNLLQLQNVVIANTITSISNTGGMFAGCRSLKEVPLFNTASVTDMSSMFSGCSGLRTVPLFNTASVTNIAFMFSNCFNLKTVPLFNTISATNMNSIFQGCSNLETVPLFNTASVTNMSNMFSACPSLKEVPLFNMGSVVSADNMFSGCRSLKEVPLFNTASINSPSFMFFNCSNLETVPLFNFSSATNLSGLFAGCSILQEVPLFTLRTSTAINASSMFDSCLSLQTLPLLNFSSATNLSGLFAGCNSLVSIPALEVTSSTNFSSIFNTCSNLSRIEAKNFRFTFSVASCKLSATALNEIYTNLPTVTGQTITVTGNYGTSTDNPAIATAKGWTVTG
jgi:surface protein